jgi:hypothetical protein
MFPGLPDPLPEIFTTKYQGVGGPPGGAFIVVEQKIQKDLSKNPEGATGDENNGDTTGYWVSWFG